MPCRVVSFTMAQVRQGALGFQRQLSAALRGCAEIKVYSVSPFDLDERRQLKERFGGDIVYFLNDAAYQECERLGLDLQFLAEISYAVFCLKKKRIPVGRCASSHAIDRLMPFVCTAP